MKTTAAWVDMNMTAGKLSPCPDSPNCVQSQYTQHRSYVPPLMLADNGQALTAEQITARWQLLRSVVLLQPGARMVYSEDNMLRIEFRSRLFRFIDDVELLLDDKTGMVHVRSASRTGYYDFGVNRKRVQTIRTLLEKALATQSSVGPR